MPLPPAPDPAEFAAAELRRRFAAGTEDPPDWEAFAEECGLGRRRLERLFRRRFGTSPGRFWADLRAEAAEALLRSGHDVLTAAVASGHSGPGRLHEAMLARRGMTPGELRALGRGVRIAFAVFDTPLGPALLAATERGLCALRLCSLASAEEHLAELRSEFPEADFAEDPAALQPYADQLVAWLEARADRFDPRLDVHGTAFQREVWAELRRVPPGETASYAEIARRLGRPRAARAVGQACGRNPIAIAIPCHRIVGGTGDLRGYRWGEEWKRRLLALEAEMRRRR